MKAIIIIMIIMIILNARDFWVGEVDGFIVGMFDHPFDCKLHRLLRSGLADHYSSRSFLRRAFRLGRSRVRLGRGDLGLLVVLGVAVEHACDVHSDSSLRR